MNERYPTETLKPYIDDGTIVNNVAELRDNVIGRRIVAVEGGEVEVVPRNPRWIRPGLTLVLDDGRRVQLVDTDDCCAYTTLKNFWLDPSAVDHVILGVGTTDGYTVWHIYADFGDIMRLNVEWSCGNPFYYGYGFDIRVTDAKENA